MTRAPFVVVLEPLRLALLGLVMAAAAQQRGPLLAAEQAHSVASRPRPVLIRADRQSYDRQRGTLVASGNVEVTLQGWRLRADRLDYAESSRSLLASGRVQLWKANQYLQASSLRYSDWEGSGELLDVYGAIDLETLERDLQGDERAASTDPAAPASAATREERPGFACPPLESHPGQRPMLELLPPGRSSVPSLPAPPGCPGAAADQRQHPLSRLLTETALGQGLESEPAPPSRGNDGATPDVRDVRYRQSLSTSIRLNLGAVIDAADSTDPSGGRYSPPRPQKGGISRVRFQASRLELRDDRWNADSVAFTNDPFTPATAWTLARQVTAVIDPSRGSTEITARRSRILLDGRLSVAAVNDISIGAETVPLELDADSRDRDGIYLGYNLPPIRLGERGSLLLQPQLMLQRALLGETDSYVHPGASLGSPQIEQGIRAGDLFGLNAELDLPVGGLAFKADLSLSTLNPDNVPSGTRGQATLRHPLGLALDPSAAVNLFSSYRERIYNGSLGLQNLIYSYGAGLSGGISNPVPGRQELALTQASPSGPGFEPLSLSWSLQSGQYQANMFESEELATLWRSSLNLRADTVLRLWRGKAPADGGGVTSLRYSAVPVVPGFGLEMGLNGSLATYSDGSDQNTLSLWGGPALTLGRFEKPWLDYTRVSVTIGGTLRSGLSPFGFDRAVDLRTLSFSAAQQIYGPLVIAGGARFNIDSDSPFYGDASYSFVELRLQRRAYEFGIFYSPYDGIGGIRLTLNDFDFTGTGTPFVPRPASGSTPGDPLSQR